MNTMFVAVDMGASETRYTTDSCTFKSIPNNYVILDMDEKTHLDSNDDTLEGNFEFVITKTGGNECDYFPVHGLLGNMAERYSTSFVRPSIVSHKHKQKVNYLSAVLSVAVSRLEGLLGSSNMNETVEVPLFLEVPPIEVTSAREAFDSRLSGQYEVEFPKYRGGVKVRFDISKVYCYEEAVMATASFFFTTAGRVKEENKQFMKGNILIIDIGASTVNLALVKDGAYINLTGRTYKVGGNIVRSSFIDLVRQQEGYNLPNDMAETAIAEGRLRQGNTYKDCGKLVEKAKKKLADKIIELLPDYFGEIDTPINTIRAVIASGGGSLSGGYVDETGAVVKTSEPLSKYITDQLMEICPGVEALDFGSDARLANIKGLYIKARTVIARLVRINADGETEFGSHA